VCEFDFETFYKALGQGFIHIHHSVPLSTIGKSYIVDPIKDLRPVYPNCHAILHEREPPYTIEELRDIILAVAGRDTRKRAS
jgi:5-methylcytosine-specific restriction protein A